MLLPSSMRQYEVELVCEPRKPGSGAPASNHDATLPLRYLGRDWVSLDFFTPSFNCLLIPSLSKHVLSMQKSANKEE